MSFVAAAMDGTNPDAKRELDWDLHIDLAEQLTHKVIRVTSNETIGTVMVKLMAKLGNNLCCRHGIKVYSVALLVQLLTII